MPLYEPEALRKKQGGCRTAEERAGCPCGALQGENALSLSGGGRTRGDGLGKVPGADLLAWSRTAWAVWSVAVECCPLM